MSTDRLTPTMQPRIGLEVVEEPPPTVEEMLARILRKQDDFLRDQAERDRSHNASMRIIGTEMQAYGKRLTELEQKCDRILEGKLAQDAHVDELTAEVLDLRSRK